MTDQELDYIVDAIRQIAKNFKKWAEDYRYDKHKNDFIYSGPKKVTSITESFFEL